MYGETNAYTKFKAENTWHIVATTNVTSAYNKPHTRQNQVIKNCYELSKANAVEDTLFLNNKRKQLSIKPLNIIYAVKQKNHRKQGRNNYSYMAGLMIILCGTLSMPQHWFLICALSLKFWVFLLLFVSFALFPFCSTNNPLFFLFDQLNYGSEKTVLLPCYAPCVGDLF